MKKTNVYAGYRYPTQIISHAVWLYLRCTLSFRDIEELLAARGVNVSYETVRQRCKKFGNKYCHKIKKNRGPLGDTWYLDEVFIKINGLPPILTLHGDSDVVVPYDHATRLHTELDRCGVKNHLHTIQGKEYFDFSIDDMRTTYGVIDVFFG